MSDKGIRITGELTQDAALLYTPGATPTAHLELHIDADIGLPYVARHPLGADPNAHMAAQAKLIMLRRGAQVAVYGAGLRAQSDHGIACLAVLRVSDVLPLGSIRKKQGGD